MMTFSRIDRATGHARLAAVTSAAHIIGSGPALTAPLRRSLTLWL